MVDAKGVEHILDGFYDMDYFEPRLSPKEYGMKLLNRKRGKK